MPEDFDPATWAELLRLFGPAGVAELVRALRADLPVQQRSQADALRAGDMAALKSVMHALCGASQQMGAEDLAEVCAQAEHAAVAGQREQASQLAEKVIARYAALVERLGNEAGIA